MGKQGREIIKTEILEELSKTEKADLEFEANTVIGDRAFFTIKSRDCKELNLKESALSGFFATLE